MIRSLLILLSICLSISVVSQSFASEDHDIDLKLFGRDVIEDYDGCRFALWQENKDPESDKYPYIFYAPIHDGGELPGWMQIGTDVFEMYRLDRDRDDEFVDRHQLYRSQDETYSLIMEINEQNTSGDDILISDARITLVRKGFFPFKSRKLKGKLGCPASAYASVETGTLEGDAISLSAPTNFNSMKAVPAPIIRHIRNEIADCDLDQVADNSASYAISDAMTLWEIPCASFASSGSSVFATALNDNPDFFAMLTVTAPPGLGENDRFDLLNARVYLETATITSYSLDTGGDCGTFESHQLRAVEGEAIELILREYRDKPNCDGVESDPENFPLVYSVR
ncbi:MAG: hypothetical protein AAGF54_03465 [Pseudomonadota bacterium]